MRRLLLTCLMLSCSAHSVAQECVILLHGMARTEKSMGRLADTLSKDGYWVVNYAYPSTQFDIAHLAKSYLPKAIAQCEGKKGIYFVTHSLGGIILRQYLSNQKIKNLRRVVMLGPPNQGSEVVDTLKGVPGFKWINGPAGLQLGTGKKSVPNTLGSVDFSLGVIAGSSTINPILSLMLPNPDDGKVSVERTKVEGMSDHITVPVSHPFLMRNTHVIQQVQVFLKTGKFDYKK